MNSTLLSAARKLRRQQTPSEVKIWSILRNKKLLNYKFYRQFPIGNYIVDFCCRSKKIIIEIDGGGHNYTKQAIKDRIKRWLSRESGLQSGSHMV